MCKFRGVNRQAYTSQKTFYHPKKSLTALCRLVWFILFCWLLIIPATCQCSSRLDLIKQLYMLPHWDRSCRSNFLLHPVPVFWHRAKHSQHWPCNTRRLAGQPLECQFGSDLYDSTRKNPSASRNWTPLLRQSPWPLGQPGGADSMNQRVKPEQILP